MVSSWQKMSAKDVIFQYFLNEFPFNREGLKEFVDSFERKIFKKGDLILEQGHTESNLRFLHQGTVREFYGGEGKEFNINFYTNQEFVTDFHSFTKSIPTKKYQQCLTKVEILVLPKQQFLEFLDKYSCGKGFVDEMFQKIIEQKEQEEYNRLTQTPEEMYLCLSKTKPQWLQKVPQYHIASYLRITPETLSRIRQRI